MDRFELGRLTDFDFEVVCKDLFEDILRTKLEIFAKGADAGIDLRRIEDANATTVIQCKHWQMSARAKLIRHMDRTERPKIEALRPGRYILATTVDLTVDAKDKLMEILRPYLVSLDDLYGVEEIVAELRSRPGIVQGHLRLWLNSAAVLQALLIKDVVTRSATLVDEIDESLKTYAPNESYTRACDILEQQRVCIIAGLPGIGKTTLARVLAASYVSAGFELVEISEDVNEANRVWDDSRAQIFYYDDFLGQANLADKMGKNEDSRLLSMLKKVRRSANKYFVLTTREYILAEARQHYEKLAAHDFSPLTCVLDLSDYSRKVRAEILYNHVFHSGLPPGQRAPFAEREVYSPILSHRNFNPRLVALSLELYNEEKDSVPYAAAANVLENLEDPRRIWQHIIENDLDEPALHLLEVLLTAGPLASLTNLEAAWQAYRHHLGRSSESRQFRRALGVTENTMVRFQRINGVITASFHNPSVRDFMRSYLAQERGAIAGLLSASISFEQVEQIWRLSHGAGNANLAAVLAAESDALVSAVIRTLEGESQGMALRHRGWASRQAAAVEIAGQLESETLGVLLANRFDDTWLDNVDDGDELVSLMKAIGGSKLTSLTDKRSEIIDAAAEWLMDGSSYDWDNLRVTISYFEELGSLVPSHYLESLHQSEFEQTERLLQNWASDQSPFTDWSMLDELVAVASAYEDAAELFPGYAEAQEALIQHREVTNTKGPKLDTVDINDNRDDDEIDALLGLLKSDDLLESGKND